MEPVSIKKRRKLQRHCYVPGCKSGYPNCSEKRSLFSVPARDPLLMEKWIRAVPRADRPLDETCAICELHFESQFVTKHFRYIINGKEVFEPRQPCLAREAVPTIFPNLPSNSTKQKKVEHSSHPEVPHKNKKVKPSCVEDDHQTFLNGNDFDYEHDVTLPTKFWAKIKYEQSPNIVCFALWGSHSIENCVPDKRVVVHRISETEVIGTVFLKNMITATQGIKKRSDLQELLNEAEHECICKDE